MSETVEETPMHDAVRIALQERVERYRQSIGLIDKRVERVEVELYEDRRSLVTMKDGLKACEVALGSLLDDGSLDRTPSP